LYLKARNTYRPVTLKRRRAAVRSYSTSSTSSASASLPIAKAPSASNGTSSTAPRSPSASSHPYHYPHPHPHPHHHHPNLPSSPTHPHPHSHPPYPYGGGYPPPLPPPPPPSSHAPAPYPYHGAATAPSVGHPHHAYHRYPAPSTADAMPTPPSAYSHPPAPTPPSHRHHAPSYPHHPPHDPSSAPYPPPPPPPTNPNGTYICHAATLGEFREFMWKHFCHHIVGLAIPVTTPSNERTFALAAGFPTIQHFNEFLSFRFNQRTQKLDPTTPTPAQEAATQARIARYRAGMPPPNPGRADVSQEQAPQRERGRGRGRAGSVNPVGATLDTAAVAATAAPAAAASAEGPVNAAAADEDYWTQESFEFYAFKDIPPKIEVTIVKYGWAITTASDFSLLAAAVAPAPEPTDRSGAPTEDRIAAVVQRLKEYHSSLWAGAEMSWRMWATLILRMPPAVQAAATISAPPTELIHLFGPAPAERHITALRQESSLALEQSIHQLHWLNELKANLDEFKGEVEDIADRLRGVNNRFEAFYDKTTRILELHIMRASTHRYAMEAVQRRLPAQDLAPGLTTSFIDSIPNHPDIDHMIE
ncbi:hypothetical protein HDU96_001666, partial [Phlyctochytrium bullatum]